MTVTAVRKDIPLPALQRLLGHDRLATTEIYLNLARRGDSRVSTKMVGC
jgi:site-specific recombinase XerD